MSLIYLVNVNFVDMHPTCFEAFHRQATRSVSYRKAIGMKESYIKHKKTMNDLA
jgi:hypothetical protein